MSPTNSERTPYDILAVARTASADEIKKRYRELARKHHPDVNRADPSAASRFAEISQAYKVLSDTETRNALDAEISLREQRARQAATATPASPYVSPYASPRPPTGNAPPRPQANTATGTTSESVRLTNEGRAAYNRDRPVEARSLAEQALRLNRRNGEAWELLGDVFRRQGRTDEAMNAYSMALQINPRNPNLMSRLERMARAAGVPPPPSGNSGGGGRYSAPPPRPAGGSAPYPNPARPTAPTPASGRVSRLSAEKRPLGRLFAGVFGYGLVFFVILWAAIYPGDAPRGGGGVLLSAVSDWNATITVALALVGLLLGATMTVTGTIRRIDDELILSGVSRAGGSYLPLGLLMIVISVVNFYLAAIIYALVTVLQESLTPSMIRVFGAVTVVVGLLALPYPHNHWQVLIFGGNVVFITFVVGWLLGDFFRADVM